MKNVVFFSGGSALSSTARELANRHIAAIYLITIFDSGGSTGRLRRVFEMPAIGDLRNRLLAVADSQQISPETIKFLNFRMGRAQSLADIFSVLEKQDWSQISEADKIRNDLQHCLSILPPYFDAGGACIGNLALTGAWLASGRNLEAALDRYAKILRTTGTILPVAEASLHLAAQLQDGSVIVGQHILNKELTQPVGRIFLTRASPWREEKVNEVRQRASEPVCEAIENADIICFSMGSFYSSILANLLVSGVGRAIAESHAIKLFIPNTGVDPELKGLDIAGQAKMINNVLSTDLGHTCRNFLDCVLVDCGNGDYPGGLNARIRESIATLGAELLDEPVVSGPGRHDPAALINVLEKLA